MDVLYDGPKHSSGSQLPQAYICALQWHVQEVKAPLRLPVPGSVAVVLQEVTQDAVDDAQVNLGAAEVGEALELVLQSLVPPKLRYRIFGQTLKPKQTVGTYRFVVQFPKSLDGQEGPHEEAVHDEQLDEAATLGLEGVDHDVVSSSDALLE